MFQMIKLNVTGLDKVKQRLEEMKKPEFLQQKMIEHICAKVPEAQSEVHKFKFTTLPNGNLELKAEGISPDLYSKITKAFAQQ
jgi:hypothetical protein